MNKPQYDSDSDFIPLEAMQDPEVFALVFPKERLDAFIREVLEAAYERRTDSTDRALQSDARPARL